MANKKHYILGLSKIEIGDIAADGGMGQNLSQLGYTYKDSCTFTMDDPETTDFYAEEVDDPVVSISKAGKTTLAFQIMNPSVEVLAAMMGGTADGTNETWDAPSELPSIEKSIRVTPEQGLMFEFPRMKITAKFDGNFAKSDMMKLSVTATVMIPEKEGVAKFHVSAIPAETPANGGGE